MIKLQSSNNAEEFKTILKKNRIAASCFVIYFSKNFKEFKNKNKLSISFVMKKKIGNAVKRNKIKRKFKSAVQTILEKQNLIDLSYTYIVIGKANAYKKEFCDIYLEILDTFKKINKLKLN